MAKTYSSMLPLETQAPNFTLFNPLAQQKQALSELRSNTGTVIVFMCNHCPFVKHILPTLLSVADLYIEKGFTFIAINSNDVNSYPDDSPAHMADLAKQLQFPFPYLFDDTQDVARSYQAACTPDFYLFDGQLKCVYRGRFDAATPGNSIPVTGNDLTLAMDRLLKKQLPPDEQHPSMGCNIKWK